MPNGIKPLCLMTLLLLSACHSAPVSQPLKTPRRQPLSMPPNRCSRWGTIRSLSINGCRLVRSSGCL